MSRWMVRSDTSSRRASAPAVSRPCACRSKRIDNSRCAFILPLAAPGSAPLGSLLGLAFLGYPSLVALATGPTPARALVTVGGAAFFAGGFLWLLWRHEPLSPSAESV